ncbi:MAG TPA: hypothetical protein ENJ33_08585, partial [Thiothrix sp.]|nr:hypothetical protein [Thiothrix sp.]
MDALKAAVWSSKLEDRRDALRLRLHTMGIKKLLNKDERESVKPKHLSLATLPTYLKEKLISGLLFLVSIPALFISLLHPKSLLGGLFLAALVIISAGLLLVAILSGSMYYYLSQPVDEKQRQHYLNQHQHRIALTLHDENNDLIGAFPPLASGTDNMRGALSVKTVPPVFWALIKAPADKSLHFAAQQPHFWTLYKQIIQFKDAVYKGVNLAAPYQTTSPPSLLQHIASSLQSPPQNTLKAQGFIDRLLNYKETLQLARHLFPYLSQNNGKEFKRWSAMHAPLLAADDDVYGLTAIAATLFGKKVTALNAGQQALLATAYHQQTPMALLFTANAKTRQATWKRLIKQSQHAATQHYKKNQPQTLRRIMTDLEHMKSAPSLAISTQWLNFLHNNPDNEQRYHHLLQRSDLTLGKLKPSLYQAIQNAVENQAKNVILTDVKISLPILQNQQLDNVLNTTFNTIQRFYPTLFSKKLGQTPTKKGALISIQIANEQGNIIRSYQRGSVSQRPIANLSDLAISSLLLAQNDRPKTRYCNKTYTGIRNASEPKRDGVSNCNALGKKGHAFSLQQSIQQEKPLPLLYALSQTHLISTAKLTTLYADFGFLQYTDADEKPSAKVLAYELSVGAVQSTPMNIHQIIHALTRQVYNIPYNKSLSMINTLYMSRLSAKGENHFTQKSTKNAPKSLQAYLPNKTSHNHMQTLLAIPSNKKNNPLKFLRSVEKKYGVDFLLVKSATS